MKKMLLSLFLIVAVAVSLIGAQTQPVLAEEGVGDEPDVALTQGQAGTTLSAEVTAFGELTRTWQWDISKSVDPASWSLFTGDSGSSAYSVSVDKTGYSDVVSVSGQVWVLNGGDRPTENLKIVVVLESKSGGGQFQPTGYSQTIIPSEQLEAGEQGWYNYEIAFTPVAGSAYRVIANVTITNHSGSLGVEKGPSPKADFYVPSVPTSEVNASVNVSDSMAGALGFVSDDTTFNYTHTFTCEDAGANNNTASIVETGQSASAAVEVTCYDLAVSKAVDTSFNRYYTWDIDKSADQYSLLLSVGQTFFPVNYTVALSASFDDADFMVFGEITVNNPAPMAAELVSVSDLMGETAGVVDCDVTFPYLLAAGESLVCSYEAELESAMEELSNVGTAELQNYDYDEFLAATAAGTTDFDSDPVAVVWSETPADLIDECVMVSDTMAAFGGPYEVCYQDLPWSKSYQIEVGPYIQPGTFYVENTASFITNDTETDGSDDWTIIITVPFSGCTLTQGYWKTHADVTSKRYDSTWNNFAGGNAMFFSTGKSYIEILWMPPSGGNVYLQLAHQYIAAKLNTLNGAYAPADVAAKIALAESILTANSASMYLKGKDATQAKALAALLDMYNNGYLGVPHCSE